MPWISRAELALLREQLADVQKSRDAALADLRVERDSRDKMLLALTDRKLQSVGQSPITDKPKKADTAPKLTALEESERASWYIDFAGQFNQQQINALYDEYRRTGVLPNVGSEVIG